MLPSLADSREYVLKFPARPLRKCQGLFPHHLPRPTCKDLASSSRNDPPYRRRRTSALFPRFRSKQNPSIPWRQRTALTAAKAGWNVRRMCSLRHFQPGWRGHCSAGRCGAQQSFLFFLMCFVGTRRLFVHAPHPLHHRGLRHGFLAHL